MATSLTETGENAQNRDTFCLGVRLTDMVSSIVPRELRKICSTAVNLAIVLVEETRARAALLGLVVVGTHIDLIVIILVGVCGGHVGFVVIIAGVVVISFTLLQQQAKSFLTYRFPDRIGRGACNSSV